MGIIYDAEHNRARAATVAVKMMKVGMDTRASESGRPYFVMEHVKGRSLN